MAYASAVALTVQEIDRTGTAVEENLVAPTATHGNKVINDGRTWLYVINGSVGDITVTVDVPTSVDGLALPDLVATVKATGNADGLDKLAIGPFTRTFEQTDGYVWAVCSAVADVLMGAFRLALE